MLYISQNEGGEKSLLWQYCNCISIIVLARGKGSKNWAIVVVELRRFYTKLTRVVEV